MMQFLGGHASTPLPMVNQILESTILYARCLEDFILESSMWKLMCHRRKLSFIHCAMQHSSMKHRREGTNESVSPGSTCL